MLLAGGLAGLGRLSLYGAVSESGGESIDWVLFALLVSLAINLINYLSEKEYWFLDWDCFPD